MLRQVNAGLAQECAVFVQLQDLLSGQHPQCLVRIHEVHQHRLIVDAAQHELLERILYKESSALRLGHSYVLTVEVCRARDVLVPEETHHRCIGTERSFAQAGVIDYCSTLQKLVQVHRVDRHVIFLIHKEVEVIDVLSHQSTVFGGEIYLHTFIEVLEIEGNGGRYSMAKKAVPQRM